MPDYYQIQNLLHYQCYLNKSLSPSEEAFVVMINLFFTNYITIIVHFFSIGEIGLIMRARIRSNAMFRMKC